jgi:hypothetical protein
METDVTANCRERDPLSNDHERFIVIPLRDQANIAGDINSRRTRMATRSFNQSLAYRCRTMGSLDVGLILIPKIADGRECRVGGCLSQTA